MRPVKIVTDSCSDMPRDLRQKYDIDYMKMNTVRNGKETPASIDWEYYSAKELYDVIRSGERVTTTMVPPSEFQKYFKAEVCIDSLNACLGEAVVAIKAAEFRDQGMSAKEIEAAILPIRNNVNQFVTVHSLNALKAAGRVSGSSAFFGNLLGVKPIIISDKVGNNIPIKKAKGRLNSLKEIVALIAEGVADEKNPTIYIAHADCIEDAREVAEMCKETIPGVKTYITYIGPIIGASIGADAIGVFAYGKSIERFAV